MRLNGWEHGLRSRHETDSRGQSCCVIDKLGLRSDPIRPLDTFTPKFTRALDHKQALNQAAAQ